MAYKWVFNQRRDRHAGQLGRSPKQVAGWTTASWSGPLGKRTSCLRHGPEDLWPGETGCSSRAQDAAARLEASVAATPEHVAAGLRARLALFEAAGYLAHRGAAVHPHDLGLA